MTIERKIVVGLDDIKAITLECECGARMTFTPELFRAIPANCSNCPKQWSKFDRLDTAPGIPAATWFLTSLRDIRTLLREKSLPFKILLEFNEPMDRQ